MLSYLKKTKHPAYWTALIVFSFFIVSASMATQIAPSEIKPIDDLFSRTPIAIEGEIIGHEDQYDEIVGALTIWEVKVVEIFKDTTASLKPGTDIKLQTMSYKTQDSTSLTIGEVGPPINAGMCVILFLQETQNGYYQLFEMRTTAFFEVQDEVVRRAVVNHFLPNELPADSLRNCFRK